MDPKFPKPDRAPRIRPTGREPRFSKLRSMACFAELHDKVLSGYGLSELARWIQEDKQEYTDVTRPSLLSVLKEYRSTIPPTELISKRMPQTFHKAEEKVLKGLNELEEFEKLYQLQLDRVNIDYEKEKGMSKLLTTTVQEVRAAREILASYADLKMDLGLTDRHLGKMEVDAKVKSDVISKYGSESVAGIVSNAESRARLLEIARNLLQLTAAKQNEALEVQATDVTIKDPSGSKT